MSDYKGAALMLPALPKANELLADKGYDADWFRAALAKRRVAACIPSKPTARPRSRTTPRSTSNDTNSKSCSAASGLAAGPHPLLLLRSHLLLGDLHRRSRSLLVVINEILSLVFDR